MATMRFLRAKTGYRQLALNNVAYIRMPLQIFGSNTRIKPLKIPHSRGRLPDGGCLKTKYGEQCGPKKDKKKTDRKKLHNEKIHNFYCSLTF